MYMAEVLRYINQLEGAYTMKEYLSTFILRPDKPEIYKGLFLLALVYLFLFVQCEDLSPISGSFYEDFEKVVLDETIPPSAQAVVTDRWFYDWKRYVFSY